MDNIQLTLLIIQVIVALILILLVLLQKTSGDSLGGIAGSNSSAGSIISGKAKANGLTKATSILIAIFMINCLIMTAISKKNNSINSSKIDKAIEQRNLQQENKVKTPSIPPIE